jgi:PAN domain/Sel1 repeat
MSRSIPAPSSGLERWLSSPLRRGGVGLGVTKLALAGMLAASAAEAQSVMQVCGGQWYAAQASGSPGGQTWQQFLAACRARVASGEGQVPASNNGLVFVGNDFSPGSRLLASLQSRGGADGVPPFVILQEFSPSGPTTSGAIFPSAGTVNQVTFYGGGKYDFTVFALALVARDATRNEMAFTVIDAQTFSGDASTKGLQTLPAHFSVQAGNYLAFAGIGPFYPQTQNDAPGSDAVYASASEPDQFPSNFTGARPVVGQTFTVGAHGDKTATYEIAPDTFGNQGRFYGIGIAYAQASPNPPATPARPIAPAPSEDNYSGTFMNPTYNGYRLDWCRIFETDCGAPAAAAFCKAQGFRGLVAFKFQPRPGAETMTIGQNSVCDPRWHGCDSFEFVRCTPSSSSPGSTVEFGTDRYGNDYRIFNVPPDNYAACQTACETDGRCQAWAYESSNPERSNGVCWLKNPAPSAVPKRITISGVILARTGQSQPASGTDALARGDEAFQVRDYMKSFRWYVVAAGQGSAQAEQNLGFLYYNGFGVQQDYSQAAIWYRKAADRGLPVGETSIGWMYQKGLGVPINYAEALRWNRKAAEQGDMNGEQNLGRLYLFGLGVPRDPVEARRLLNLAAAQGSSEAKAILEGRGE